MKQEPADEPRTEKVYRIAFAVHGEMCYDVGGQRFPDCRVIVNGGGAVSGTRQKQKLM